MRSILFAVLVAACGGGSTTTPISDAPPFFPDAPPIQTGSPLISGDTITARTDHVEITAASIGGLAVWLDTTTHVAHGAVVDGTAHVVGQAFAFATLTDVTAVHALALSDRNALAVGLVSTSGGYLVAAVDGTGTVSTPIALVTPLQSACVFAPPDQILCAGATAGTEKLGTIAPGSATVAFGTAHALPPVTYGLRSGGGAFVFTDANGCGQIASYADTNDFGTAQAMPCAQTSPVADVQTAIEPMPTNESAFARAFVSISTDATHRSCSFFEFTAGLVATQTAMATDAACPRAVSWGGGQLYGIHIEANGTATLVTHDQSGFPQPFPNPVLGIGNLIAADVVAGVFALALVAIADGERVQFAVFDGSPI